MPWFRAKPVLVEAVRWPGDVATADLIEEWSRGATALEASEADVAALRLRVKSIDGDVFASPGDWIIRGTEGEFYPCKPRPFRKKYERPDLPRRG